MRNSISIWPAPEADAGLHQNPGIARLHYLHIRYYSDRPFGSPDGVVILFFWPKSLTETLLIAAPASFDPYLLAAYKGERPPAPDWYCDAMRQCPGMAHVVVDGASIEYLVWGKIGCPGLLLVHGGLANAYWWAHIAPILATEYRVAALSLSGMGQSGHRAQYSMEVYALELQAVARAAGLDIAGPPVVAGHSFGVAPTLVAVAEPDSWACAAILIDGDPIAIGKGAPLPMRRTDRLPFPT